MRWSKWDNTEDIPATIPQFLDSNYQSVRLAAIRNLHVMFSMTCENEAQLARQKEIFESVCLKVTFHF